MMHDGGNAVAHCPSFFLRISIAVCFVPVASSKVTDWVGLQPSGLPFFLAMPERTRVLDAKE